MQVRGGAENCVVRGNFLGTDATGFFARPDNSGVEIGSDHNHVGGTSPADRNLVSGNTAGTFSGALMLDGGANNSTVQGNLVGTDATGLHALPNVGGMAVYGTGNTIGGTVPGAANVISGNSLYGVWVEGSAVFQGNLVGIAADGASPLGNASDGIRIHSSNDSTIGGVLPGEGNRIAYNGNFGVNVEEGVHNTVRGNSIHDNGPLGLNLYTGGSAPKPNDAGDADNGSNNLQNYPIVQAVVHLAGSTEIVGKLDSTPTTTFDLDFYSNPACSNFPREFVEGETYIGSTQLATDDTGHVTFTSTLPVATEDGARISVTATDPDGNTSEFSQRIIFSMGPASGPASGGTLLGLSGTDFVDPTTMTIGGLNTPVTFVDDHTLNSTSPALAPGTVNDVVVTTPDGTTGTLIKGWVADFLDVPNSQQFYSFVTTLVSNAITVGVGGGNYGVDQPTLRQQMAVFLMKARHGLCFVPPPCTTQIFTDVPCSSGFAPWINELVAEGITGGCGDGTTYCPTDPVKRQQMAVLLLRTLEGSATRLRPASRRPSATSPATARSHPGSTSSSPAASPAAAATATTARPTPRPAARWRSSSSRPSSLQ